MKNKDSYDEDQLYAYAGPRGMEKKVIESEIKRILPYYLKYMEDDSLEKLIDLGNDLKFNKIKIDIYERLNKLDKGIDIYLKSDGLK